MLIKNILIFILNSKRNEEKKVEKLGRATAKILMMVDIGKRQNTPTIIILSK